jgi:UDPglucose 6-dehydrogenase
VENATAGQAIRVIYKRAVLNYPHFAAMSPESEKVMKISLNYFVATKIADANMIGDIADRTPGASKFNVLAAIGHDSRVGTKYFMPRWAYGGPCFPRARRVHR